MTDPADDDHLTGHQRDTKRLAHDKIDPSWERGGGFWFSPDAARVAQRLHELSTARHAAEHELERAKAKAYAGTLALAALATALYHPAPPPTDADAAAQDSDKLTMILWEIARLRDHDKGGAAVPVDQIMDHMVAKLNARGTA